MNYNKHYEFLAPRGAGKSAFRDRLCLFLKKNLSVKALRSRKISYLSLARRFLPSFLTGNPEVSYRLGRIISKSFYYRKDFEEKAYLDFMEDNNKINSFLRSLKGRAGEKSVEDFIYWFKIVAGRFQLSRLWLKPDELLCFGGGFVFCLEHLFSKVKEEEIEELLSLLPKPKILIRIESSEEDLLRIQKQRGAVYPDKEKIYREIERTRKLAAMALRQGIKIISFKNDYRIIEFPPEVKDKILNLSRKGNLK